MKKFYEHAGRVVFAANYDIYAKARALAATDRDAALEYLSLNRPYERLNKIGISAESDLAFATSEEFVLFR